MCGAKCFARCLTLLCIACVLAVGLLGCPGKSEPAGKPETEQQQMDKMKQAMKGMAGKTMKANAEELGTKVK